jgi:hypothetical protein
MARIRFNYNSFSTGFVSKKILGNSDFEGYNQGLLECTNFIIQHTGGCFKRGGTEFIAYTKNNGEAELVPFYFSADESYMCEFGNQYVRFYTKYGPILKNDNTIFELPTTFSLADFRKATVFQNGNVMTIIMQKGVFLLLRKSEKEFSIAGVPFTYPPLRPINYSNNTCINITKTAANTYKVVPYNKNSNPPNLPPPEEAPFFYPTDVNQILVIGKTENDVEKKYVLRITAVTDYQQGFTQLTCVWDPNLNTGAPPASLEGVQLEWQISQFTADRLDKENLGVGLYEGRLFLGSENLVWGSSLALQDILDFKLGTNDDDAVAFLINEVKSDRILWMIGQSKLFLATSSGLFLGGAATFNDSAVTPANFRVRLFETIGSSPVKPISAMNTIFFVDSSNINLHEIVLSAETGVYQANDLSLLGNDLTVSGIIAHTWQQNPIKTYWCAVEDGYLCSLTYLKNNGVMAWAKHVISGSNVKVESLNTLQYKSSANVWMVVKRQINNQIVRSIEYMHSIYNPLAQEEFKQFFVDSGKIKELKHTITNISQGNNYSFTSNEDIRPRINDASANASELKIMFRVTTDIPPPAPGQLKPNPIFDRLPFVAKNFRKKNNTFLFDFFTSFDEIRTLKADGTKTMVTYTPYRNQQIAYGKIDPDSYQNVYANSPKAEIYAKVSEIRNVSLGDNTFISCDLAKLKKGDSILFHHSDLRGDNWVDYSLQDNATRTTFIVGEIKDGAFQLNYLNNGSEERYKTNAKYSPNDHGEIYKKVTGEFILTSTNVASGANCVITVEGQITLSAADERDHKGGDVYVNKVSGMTEINGVRYRIKSVKYYAKTDKVEAHSEVKLFNYLASPDENDPQYLVPLDAAEFSIYDVDKPNNGNMYEYFTRVDGLDHLVGQTVSVCSNGNSLANRIVEDHTNESPKWCGFTLDHPSMYCVAGLPMKATLETTPFSGGSVLGSSVGVVGQQVHAVFHLYYSLGGKYGAEKNRTYAFPYAQDSPKPFNQPKKLFTGIKKLPLLNAQNIYERRIYVEHEEPIAFNLLSITQEIQVTDA